MFSGVVLKCVPHCSSRLFNLSFHLEYLTSGLPMYTDPLFYTSHPIFFLTSSKGNNYTHPPKMS